jgi:glutamate/aspartate transport system substrate-binding protein
MRTRTLLVTIALCTVTATNAVAQTPNTIEKAKATGALTLGVRESSGALSYSLGDGRYAGFHVELCQRIVAEVERQIGRKIDTRYQSVNAQNRIPLLQNGTIDIECGNTTNNATRQKDVGFLNTTFVEEVRIAVKARSGITSIAQLNGRTVATTTGTTSVQHLRRHERAAGVDFKEVFGKDNADSFLLLETDRAEAFVMDGAVLAGNIALAKTPQDFSIVGEVLSVEPIAIMVRKDDDALTKLGNDVVGAMISSGELSKLWDKWFMQPIPPKNLKVGMPLSSSTRSAWANPNSKPMEDYARK